MHVYDEPRLKAKLRRNPAAVGPSVDIFILLNVHGQTWWEFPLHEWNPSRTVLRVSGVLPHARTRSTTGASHCHWTKRTRLTCWLWSLEADRACSLPRHWFRHATCRCHPRHLHHLWCLLHQPHHLHLRRYVSCHFANCCGIEPTV